MPQFLFEAPQSNVSAFRPSLSESRKDLLISKFISLNGVSFQSTTILKSWFGSQLFEGDAFYSNMQDILKLDLMRDVH